MAAVPSSDRLRIEVAYALPGEQALISLEVEPGTTVQDAIERSRIAERFPGESLGGREVGIWGRPVARQARVRDGDRIEIYRELGIDPREARRKLASAGKTMADQADGD